MIKLAIASFLAFGWVGFAHAEGEVNLLKQAATAAAEERASLERSVHQINETAIPSEAYQERKIAVEVGGDGLVASGGNLHFQAQERSSYYQERAAFSRLDRERRELNREFQHTQPSQFED